MTTPPLDDLLARLHVVAIPMRVPFRGVTTREAALVEGPAGWGEFGPFLEYEPPEAARWLAAAIESGYDEWPAPQRTAVPVNATVPAVAAQRVPGILARFPGCDTVKVKIGEPGQGRSDDVDRVAAVRDHLGPAGRIRVDANGAFDVAAATGLLARLAPYSIDYIEQPCATVPELRDVRRALARGGLDIKVAADESIRKAEDPLRVAKQQAADLVVVKVAPLGGVRRALDIVDACGLPAVVSSALDTSVGIAAGVALAAALPDLYGACGLGTLNLMAGDVTSDPLLPRDGTLPVCRPVPSAELLQEYAVAPAREKWWRERVAACYPLLPA